MPLLKTGSLHNHSLQQSILRARNPTLYRNTICLKSNSWLVQRSGEFIKQSYVSTIKHKVLFHWVKHLSVSDNECQSNVNYIICIRIETVTEVNMNTFKWRINASENLFSSFKRENEVFWQFRSPLAAENPIEF